MDMSVLKKMASGEPELGDWLEKRWQSGGWVSDTGLTPLHLAAGDGDAGCVIASLLLEAGADPMARDSSGWTPLHWAGSATKEKRCRGMITLLICANPAAAMAADRTGRLPYHCANETTYNMANDSTFSWLIREARESAAQAAASRQAVATERLAFEQARIADSMEEARARGLAARLGSGFLTGRMVSTLGMVAAGDMDPGEAEELLRMPAKGSAVRATGDALRLAETGMDMVEAERGVFLEREPGVLSGPAKRRPE